MKPVTTVSALFAGLLFAAGALAQATQPSSTTPSTAPGSTAADATTAPAAQGRPDTASAERADKADKADKLAKSDADFLKQAAQNGQAEIEASRLAQTKATQADIKSFAEKMIEEHTKAQQELQQLAASKGVELPTEPSLGQRAKLKMLEAADGERFDKRYADSFGVKAHEDTVKLFREAADEAKDADVKAFAQKTLAAVQQHLTMAEAMQASVDPSAAGKRDDKAGERASATDRATTGSAAPGDKGDKGDKDKKY